MIEPTLTKDVHEFKLQCVIGKALELRLERDQAVARYEGLRLVAISLVSFQAVALMAVAAYLYWRSM